MKDHPAITEMREATKRIGEKNRKRMGAENYVPMQSLLDDHSTGRTGWLSDLGGNVPTREEAMVMEGLTLGKVCPECYMLHKGECL